MSKYDKRGWALLIVAVLCLLLAAFWGFTGRETIGMVASVTSAGWGVLAHREWCKARMAAVLTGTQNG